MQFNKSRSYAVDQQAAFGKKTQPIPQSVAQLGAQGLFNTGFQLTRVRHL